VNLLVLNIYVSLKMISDLEETFSGPATPPREVDSKDDLGRGKKRHRRAKGKRKKQKICLMITNEDGIDSTTKEDGQGKKKVYLRPSNNPLLKAPKNSTQFIIDDHENSNLFWNFDAAPIKETEEKEADTYNEDHTVFQLETDENVYNAFSEKDFESVYETAHHEEVQSWGKSRIIEEMNCMESRYKKLQQMLSLIDPCTYIEKLQEELLVQQEQNKELMLINFALKFSKQQDVMQNQSHDQGEGLPDSTSRDTEEESGTSDSESSSSSDSESSSDDEGGCESGCCLRDSEDDGGGRDEESDENQIELVSEQRLEAKPEVEGSRINTDDRDSKLDSDTQSLEMAPNENSPLHGSSLVKDGLESALHLGQSEEANSANDVERYFKYDESGRLDDSMSSIPDDETSNSDPKENPTRLVIVSDVSNPASDKELNADIETRAQPDSRVVDYGKVQHSRFDVESQVVDEGEENLKDLSSSTAVLEAKQSD